MYIQAPVNKSRNALLLKENQNVTNDESNLIAFEQME